MIARTRREPDAITTSHAAAILHDREVGWGRGCGVSDLLAGRVARDIKILVLDVVNHLEIREPTRSNQQALADLDAVVAICAALEVGVAQ